MTWNLDNKTAGLLPRPDLAQLGQVPDCCAPPHRTGLGWTPRLIDTGVWG